MAIITLEDIMNTLVHYPEVLKCHIEETGDYYEFTDEGDMAWLVDKYGDKDLGVVEIDTNENGIVIDIYV